VGAKVLNGTVEVGDRIAVGVRDGNSGGIRLAEVMEIVPFESRAYNYELRKYEPVTVYQLKAKVILTSGYGQIGKANTYSVLDRVVKVG